MKPSRFYAIGAWATAYLTLVVGLIWSRHIGVPYLIAGLTLWALSCGLLIRARLSRLISIPLIAGVLLLGVSLVAQSYALWRISRIATDWREIVAERHANMHEMLTTRVGVAIAEARSAAVSAARMTATTDTVSIFRTLATLRQRSKVDALALFGEAGQLVAWDGEHRAQIPQNVRLGTSGPVFVEQPLYSYAYIPIAASRAGSRVVAAVLLSTALHEHAHDVSDRSIAHVTSHLGASFREGPGPVDAWPLVIDGDTIAHARLTPLTQSEHRAEWITRVQRIVTMLGLIALVLLAIAWLRRPNIRLSTVVPLLAASVALAFAPLRAFGLDELFSPALFLLPVPVEISLGTLLAILLAIAALAASVQSANRMPRVPTMLVAAGAGLVALGYPAVLRLLLGPGAGAPANALRSAGEQLLLGGPAYWFGLHIAAVLLLGIVTELAMPRWHWFSRLETTVRMRSSWVVMLIGSLLSSASLSVIVLLYGQTRHWVTPWLAASWALPFLLAAFALAGYRGGGLRLIRWTVAGWLAATAVLPFMWIAHVDAQLADAERDLSTLGSNPDPFLDYLLMQFAREASTRARSGETEYLLLYRSWVASGLARESYSAQLTVWSPGGAPEVQLPLGNIEDPAAIRPLTLPPYLEAAFARVRENPDSVELMRVQGIANVNQALILAIDSVHILTVEVPPRRSLEHRDIPFIASNIPENTHVELVRPRPGVQPPRSWEPVEAGWRSEKPVHYADGEYHAHMEVRLPAIGVRIARGVLLIAIDLLLFTLLWLLGRAARGEHLALRAGWRDWRGSFRARVTATLFFFFLIPTTVFGWVAFSALAREVTRATRIVAERAARQAVVEFQDTSDLTELARHAGADVLYYFDGELAGASSPEVRDLGVYGAWMPANVFMGLSREDKDAEVGTRQIAGQQVLTAYRALVPAGTLAVPMSLESGDTAIRQRELAHLILFAALIGGLLSLMLSVVVGRALTGPIGRLQRAAAQVGAGNLRVRMPEHTGDEFGQLFETFNRMVRRLRRARTQQIRTARVLAWGEMARQVAHEIKNPLTPIKLAVQHLKRAHADRKPNFGELLDENVDQILLEIDRLSDIARAFSRYGAPEASSGPLEAVQVQQVVHEAMTLYRAGDPEVEYTEDVDGSVGRALGRSGELKEVLLNLLENARNAIDGPGGRIAVSAILIDDGVQIAVTDNGPGIPADFLSRVFEPHFSTRSSGTGLGLAIVRRLVESWGGSVTAESELGAGTTIRVNLRQA